MSELRSSRSGPTKIQQFGATDENIARLVNQDWDELASLVVLSQSSVPLEMLPEMAETLSEFMKAHDLLEQFLKWCIEQEVSSTKEFNLLFREDSFVIMLLNRLVFGDLGIKYLSGVLHNLITSIIKYEKPLELNRMKVNDEEWNANVQVVMKFLSDFLPHFAKSARLCPIPMRHTFACLQSAVDTKFGKQETPFALEFIFFHYICPAVINPKKYDLVKESIPAHALPGLIASSKLLNDLAMNATDKWKEKEVSDFIFKRHPMLLQHLHLLTDEKDIFNTKQLISSSVSTVTASADERQRAANRWKQFLTALAYYHRKGSMTSMSEENKLYPSSQEMFQLKQLEFLDFLSNPDWKLEKEKPIVYQIKDKERPTVITLKCETIIESPVHIVFAAIKEFQWHKKTDSLISQVESLFVSQFYSENYIVYRLPFPLNNRDLVFYQWEYEEDNRCCIVQDNLSGKVQRKKGMVRAQMLLSGWLVEKAENGGTRVVRLSQFDPKGSLPQWVTNAMASSQSSKLGYLKELVEKRSRKGSLKRDSKTSSRDSRVSRDSGTWDLY